MESTIQQQVKVLVKELYGIDAEDNKIVVRGTLPEFEGDYTVVVFPLAGVARKAPQQVAQELGEGLKATLPQVASFNVIKGFLNLVLANSFWSSFLSDNYSDSRYGLVAPGTGKPIVVEFSSPNTNKPLHLGHIRNNLLGDSVSRILVAAGYPVKKVNLINDRVIHICKSMLAWEKFGSGETPQTTGIKGDHLVGKYYVRFQEELNAEKQTLREKGVEEDRLEEEAPLMQEARKMLKKWEEGDEKVLNIWQMMNQWVMDGFRKSYQRMDISFDKVYRESDTYLKGKKMVLKALEDNKLLKKEDGAVYARLSHEKLNDKILLRKDGTSVYMTQDLGTAKIRYDEFNPQSMVYVVGNEQDYHFKVLKLVLNIMGYSWAHILEHLSYGMVELPDGKMKSREGTVVDADDLMDQMVETAGRITRELGKIEDVDGEEGRQLFHMISMGALKYFILKVDPKKNMTFNPEESINFTGDTGPFIQYTHARICSLLRKAGYEKEGFSGYDPEQMLVAEKNILKKVARYPSVIQEAAREKSPALVAAFVYDLVKMYNHFYQDTPVLKEKDPGTVSFRLTLSAFTGQVIRSSMALLGIQVPEKM